MTSNYFLFIKKFHSVLAHRYAVLEIPIVQADKRYNYLTDDAGEKLAPEFNQLYKPFNRVDNDLLMIL